MVTSKHLSLKVSFLIGIILFFSVSLFAQSIDGTSTFCPGERSTYSFTSASGWTSDGTMTCVGCDQSSIEADGRSISLVWLPNATSYYVSLPIKLNFLGIIRKTIFFDPLGGNPVLICATESSSFYVSRNKAKANDSGCSQELKTYAVLVNGDPLNYPFDKSQGDNNTGMHVTINSENAVEFTGYWAQDWHGTITVKLQYDRRTKSSNPFAGSCDVDITDVETFTWQRYTGSPNGTLTGPDGPLPINSTVSLNYEPDYLGMVSRH